MFDALWLNAGLRDRVESEIIAPLGATRDDEDIKAAEEAAATRVDFFTLVRGDD